MKQFSQIPVGTKFTIVSLGRTFIKAEPVVVNDEVEGNAVQVSGKEKGRMFWIGDIKVQVKS